MSSTTDARRRHEASVTRKRKGSTCDASDTPEPKDPTHFDRAWAASCKLFEAETEYADAPRGRRATLGKKVRAETAKLKGLTDRDRELTRLLDEYPRQHGELTNIADFIRWCKEEKGALTMIEEEAVRLRLRRDYGVRGESGRKPSK
jgi:hypothetical protein